MPKDSSYHLSYAISKQLPSACSLNSSYGELELDEEMRAAIENALVPILEKRLNASPELEESPPELSIEPEFEPEYLFGSGNIVILCKSCGKQLSPFEVANNRLIPAGQPDKDLCNTCSY